MIWCFFEPPVSRSDSAAACLFPLELAGTDGPDLVCARSSRCCPWSSCLIESGGLLAGWRRETVVVGVVGTESPLLLVDLLLGRLAAAHS